MKKNVKCAIAALVTLSMAAGLVPAGSVSEASVSAWGGTSANTAGISDGDFKKAADSANVVEGWTTYTNTTLPELASAGDSSLDKEKKFTHNEWTGNTYDDVDGNSVKAAEVYAINRKEDSYTSTAAVSYDSVEKAIVGARDYSKQSSAYVQYLTGSEDSVKDWSLVVVQNQTEAQKAAYADFYSTGYDVKESDNWKKNLELPCSWTMQGFDFPIYSNVTMPWQSAYDNGVSSPRSATKYNPVGMYRKNFKVGKGLVDAKGRVNISFQGVESCYYVYVNGREVGYSEDSYSPHSFDITDYLVKDGNGNVSTDAENLLAVEVHKFCDGTWMEDQDFFYDGGIFRDVYLYATPLIHLEDYFVQTDLDDDYVNAYLTMKDVEVVNYSTSSIPADEYAIDVALYNEDGSLFMNGYKIDVPAIAAGTADAPGKASVADSDHFVSAPKLWSCEQPNLYVMVVTLYNKNTGAYIESLSQNLGFREIGFTRSEVNASGRRTTNDFQQMTINGQPFYIKGVNRHDTDPKYGKAVPHSTYMEDIKVMKQFNVNAIRTSHYSNDEYLYYLCDKYGMYMMAETNVESHALQNNGNGQVHFKKLVLDRTNTTFERLKNRTANIMWSTGNENHYNDSKTYADGMFYDLIWYFKDHDDTRPVHSESSHSQNGTDMDSDMYPYNIKGIIDKGKVTMPYVMCEYDHAMGNAVGSIAEYWYAIRNANNHNMLGGFIWDWVDQSRFWSLDNVKNEFKGKAYDYYAEPDAHQNLYADDNDYHFFGYGGDYGDRPNDGSFCVNGLVSPDRDPQPELYEVKYQYQNFWFNDTTQEDFEGGWLHVYNESSFDNMNKFDLVMSVYEDDKCIGSETRTVDLAPRADTDVDIDYMKYIPQVKEGAEYRVNFEVKTKAALEADLDGSKVVLVPAGHEIAHEQFEIKNIRKAMAKTIATNKVDVSESDDVYKVKGDQFSFDINKQTGVIENYVYRDETLMITGPVPNFWRAPTNNDRNLERGWQQVGASVKADNIEVSENDKKQTVIKVDMSFDKAEGVTQTTEYTIDGSGAVTIAIKFDPTKCTFSEKRMLRVGTEMTLAENYEHVYWLGNGPSETMTDRCSGATVNAFETTVNRMFYPYLDTQETGTVTGLRWFTVTNEWNKTALAVAAKEDFEASALHFTDDQLTTARHPYELEKLDTTVLSVNNISTGAGNASCGPDTLDEYRITSDKTYEYEYTLVPYTASNAFWGVPEYVSEATRMYRSEPSDYVYAEVKDVDKERPTPTPAPIQPTAVPTQTQAPAVTSAPTPSAAPSQAPVKTDAVTKPAAVKKLTAKCVSRKKGVKLSWKKISSAKGYVLERSLKKNKGFKAVKVLNKNSVVKFTDKKVKKGKTYYYRIRAFVKDGSKKVYGKYSKVVKVKVKK